MRYGHLREDGPFAIETHTELRKDLNCRRVVVVYADTSQPSHCVWLVPGSEEELKGA